MNDPGLDGPISDAGQQVDGHHQYDEDSDSEEAEENNFLLPSRWWFTSTAFPLLAGTFGPMANAFNVCALVQNWRVSIPPGGTEEHGIDHNDPPWLIAINAVSLVFALTANIALLLNMARRVRFGVAQSVTIAGFYIACFLLIGLVSAAGGGFIQLRDVGNQALTQAYYYAIFAAGLYFIIAWLMMFTVLGAHRGHYSKEFKLTISQRTLMLQTISYLVYLLLGALIYSKVENWKYLDAVYFANFTLLTVGIGDYSPSTHVGRAFLFPYAIGGIVSLGLVVGSIRSLVLDRGKKKLSSRNFEKTRNAVLRRLSQDNGPWYRKRILVKKVQAKEPHFSLTPEKTKDLELKRRKSEFHIMREIQNLSAVERKWMSLFISSSVALTLWFVGAVIFWVAEKNQDWTYFQSLYFAYTSLLTIGYGDLSPMSNSGKPFFVFWSLLAIPTLTILISNMGDTVVKGIKNVTLVLGELTVLPGEEGSFKNRTQLGISKIIGGHYTVGHGSQREGEMNGRHGAQMGKEDQAVAERSAGISKEPQRPSGGGSDNRNGRSSDGEDMVERLAGDMEQAEAQEVSQAHERGDMKTENEHHYRLLLIREIRKVYADVGAKPPVRYPYEKWSYYLSLLGEDEGSHKYHRAAQVDVAKRNPDRRSERQLGSAGPIGSLPSSCDKKTSSFDKSNSQPSHAAPGSKQSNGAPGCSDNDGHNTPWSWIGDRSPLMGDKSEAEWLLDRLVAQLEAELEHARRTSRDERTQREEGESR